MTPPSLPAPEAAPPEDPPPRVRARMTFEGAVFTTSAALFALAALLLRENLVVLLGCLAFGCGEVAGLVARWNLRSVRVRREAPLRARVGAPAVLRYRLEGPPRRPAVGVDVEDRLGPHVRPTTLRLVAAGLGAGEGVEREARVLFLRRGLQGLGPLEVSSRHPLGFFRATASVPARSEVLVRPREGRVTGRWKAWFGGATEARRRRASLQRHGDDAFHGIRDFRDGDDPRRIHWRTSARSGSLTVTEWRREQGRAVLLLLGRGHGAGPADRRAFERAVGATATLWRHLRRTGADARLDLGAAATRRGGGYRGLGEGLDALAMVRSQGGRRPRGSLRRATRRGGERVVVYVATGPEAGIERRLREAAGPGGRWLLLRSDREDLGRFVGGLA